jgi:beta-N-acetylhexosaminidase
VALGDHGEDFAPCPTAASFGHHFLVGLQKSPVLTDHDKRLLAALRPSGVILFRDNFAHDRPYPEWLELHRRQLHEVRQAIGRQQLLVAIDHEGGPVLRTPPPITRFAAAARWPDRAAAVGAAMGRELASLGVNVDFAPVADIHSEPDNPVIGVRALGKAPEAVAAAAVDFLRGLEAGGVLGCAKHFPGHGATSADSHHELPIVEAPIELLRERELVPFAALIRAGVPLVMTAHILFPLIDPNLPATLSPFFLGDILRRELGFAGVVVSDDIGMRAVAERFARPEAAAQALAAGCDLIAICAHLADTNQALALAAGMAREWRFGRLATEVLERSHGRISRLVGAAPSHEVEELPAAVFADHRRLAPLVA